MPCFFKRQKLTQEEKEQLKKIEHEAFFAEKKAQQVARMEVMVRQAKEKGKKKATPFSVRAFKGMMSAGQKLNRFAEGIDYDGIFESYTGKPKKKKTKKK